MKLYTKIIDGLTYIMPANKIVIIKDDMQIFNPSEEMLFEDGWKVYVPVVTEVTDGQMLKQEIENIIEEILEYDSSANVNVFYINEMPI